MTLGELLSQQSIAVLKTQLFSHLSLLCGCWALLAGFATLYGVGWSCSPWGAAVPGSKTAVTEAEGEPGAGRWASQNHHFLRVFTQASAGLCSGG